MSRRTGPKPPQPVLQFAGISEPQWRFLRFRSHDESDAEAARAAGVSPRTVEGWKRRCELFRAMHSFAMSHPRLFASGELSWRYIFAEPRRERNDAVDAAGLMRTGALFSREQPDTAFQRALREHELAVQPGSLPVPVVDLAVPEQYRRVSEPPREMGEGERALARALGVEHAVVLGRWNGEPSLEARPRHEAAVDIVAEFTPGFRIERWYPVTILLTSAGLVAVADGALEQVVGCPVKRKGRCPYIGDRARFGGSCSLWNLALGHWLDAEPPSERARLPICDRDFTIARLLAYVATATMRAHSGDGGWYAGFPVIAVATEAEHAYWESRATHWNKLILDPWHRLRVVDRETIVRAAVDFEMSERIENQSSRCGGPPARPPFIAE